MLIGKYCIYIVLYSTHELLLKYVIMTDDCITKSLFFLIMIIKASYIKL